MTERKKPQDVEDEGVPAAEVIAAASVDHSNLEVRLNRCRRYAQALRTELEHARDGQQSEQAYRAAIMRMLAIKP